VNILLNGSNYDWINVSGDMLMIPQKVLDLKEGNLINLITIAQFIRY